MKTYLRVLGYAFKYKKELTLHIFFIVLAVVFSGLTFQMIKPLLEFLFYAGDKAVLQKPEFSWGVTYITSYIEYYSSHLLREESPQKALLFVAGVVVGFNVIGNIFRYIANLYLAHIRTKVVENIRTDIYEKLLYLDIPFFEKRNKGDVLNRLTSDVVEVEQTVSTTFEGLLRDPITIIFYLYLMIVASWQLTVFLLFSLPIAAILISFVTKSLKRNALGIQNVNGQLMSTGDETLMNMRIIKAFHAEKYLSNIFDKLNREYTRLSKKQWYKRALAPLFSESSGVMTIGIIMLYGGQLVYNKEMAAAGFITYIALVSQIIRPAKALSQSFGNIFKGVASAERIFEVVDAKSSIKEIENPIKINGTAVLIL
jgi:subfamily B ATP-binding cassette protein MsbA